MLLFGEGSEATEPYNKYEPLQMNEVPCILAVTALILSRFENRLFCPASRKTHNLENMISFFHRISGELRDFFALEFFKSGFCF